MKAIKASAFLITKGKFKILPVEKGCTDLDLMDDNIKYYIRYLIIRDSSGLILFQNSRVLNFRDKFFILSNGGDCYLEADDSGQLIIEEDKKLGGNKIFVLLNP